MAAIIIVGSVNDPKPTTTKIDKSRIFGDRENVNGGYTKMWCSSTKTGTYPNVYYVKHGYSNDYKYAANSTLENGKVGYMIVDGVIIEIMPTTFEEDPVPEGVNFISFREAIGRCIMDDESWG